MRPSRAPGSRGERTQPAADCDAQVPLGSFLLSTAACALAAAATSNGFFLVARPLSVAVLPAIIAALIVTRPWGAAFSCAAGVAAGVAAAPLSSMLPAPGRWALLGATIAAAAFASLAALALAVLVRRAGRRAVAPLVAGALAFLTLTLWTTAWKVASGPLSGRPPLVQALPIEPPPGGYVSDEAIYSRVSHLVGRGVGYYEAVRIAWNEKGQTAGDPVGTFSFRLPTLFWLWSILPGSAAALVPAMLVFGTVALVAAYRLASRIVREPFALVGAALVAVFYTREASASHLLQAEPWGAALALVGAAGWASALTAGNGITRARWTWLAAGSCLAATLLREHFVLVPLAALAVALGASAERARKAWIPWLVALVLFAAAMIAHAAAAAAHTDSVALPLGRWFAPGTRHLVATVAFGAELLGGLPWMPWMLLALALAGAAVARPAPLRGFLLLACAAPLVGFLIARPPGTLPDGGQPGYWGATVTPLLWATAPLAFGWTRSARAPRPGGD